MENNILKAKQDHKFINIKVPVYTNKSNGQLTILLPKKKMSKQITKKGIPKLLSMRVMEW